MDWKEPWLLGLLGFHITTTVAIVLLRNHQVAQACILSVLGRCAPVYLTAGATLTHRWRHLNISMRICMHNLTDMVICLLNDLSARDHCSQAFTATGYFQCLHARIAIKSTELRLVSCPDLFRMGSGKKTKFTVSSNIAGVYVVCVVSKPDYHM